MGNKRDDRDPIQINGMPIMEEPPQAPPGALPNELFQMRSIVTGTVIPVRTAQDTDLIRAIDGAQKFIEQAITKINELGEQARKITLERDGMIGLHLSMVAVLAAMQFELERRQKTGTLLNGRG